MVGQARSWQLADAITGVRNILSPSLDAAGQGPFLTPGRLDALPLPRQRYVAYPACRTDI